MSVPGCFGDEGVCSVGFWEESLFLFLGRWYRGWQEKAPWSMKFELCSLHDAPSNRPKFVYLLCIICYILYKQSTTVVVVSLYATAGMYWFSVCWGHVTNVTQEG